MTTGTPLFERLRTIRDDVPREGALNMALDEVLMQGAADVPLLRFYRWVRPTVTFGYFEPVASARRVARGRGIVRRLTGGGIVEHGDDLTFTLIVPRADPFARGRSTESYRQIHEVLAGALEQSGLLARAQVETPSYPVKDRQPNACFERPVLHDLMAAGKKIAGGAQRRTRAGLLHQGSIRPDAATDAGWRDRVVHALPLALARVCDPATLLPDEAARAETLAAARYATAAWTDRV